MWWQEWSWTAVKFPKVHWVKVLFASTMPTFVAKTYKTIKNYNISSHVNVSPLETGLGFSGMEFRGEENDHFSWIFYVKTQCVSLISKERHNVGQGTALWVWIPLWDESYWAPKAVQNFLLLDLLHTFVLAIPIEFILKYCCGSRYHCVRCKCI